MVDSMNPYAGIRPGPPRLPSSLKIGPLRYTVIEGVDEFYKQGVNPGDHYGYTHHSSAQILIHPDMAPQMRRVILVHEVLHAVAFAAGFITTRKQKEESWVTMSSPMLVEALRDNPGLVAFLLADEAT